MSGQLTERERVAVAVAVDTEYTRIMRAAGTQINTRELSSFLPQATALLTELVPGFQESTWVDQDGGQVTGRVCNPYQCCGYCDDCEEHHGDGREDVCNMGHCHDCNHDCSR